MQMKISMVRESFPKKLSVRINFTEIPLNAFYSTFLMWGVPSVLCSIVRGNIWGGGGGGAVIYVGRYVEYVNPTPPLLNSSEIGAVYDSQPSGK